MPGMFPPDIDKAALTGAPPPSGLSADEKLAYEQLALEYAKGIGYGYQMGLRPQALYGIADSPVGVAGYFLDHDARSLAMISRAFDGLPEGPDADDVLDNVTLTWLTNTFISGARLYWEASRARSLSSASRASPSRLRLASFLTNSIKLRGVGQSARIPNSSTTTSSREADTSRPGNSRSSLPKSFAPASDPFANRH